MEFNSLPPGAMWYMISAVVDGEYELNVKLPGGDQWNVDRGRLLHEAGTCLVQPSWSRSGEPPHVSVTPSINCVGVYHGFLRDGELTDDIDGRQY